MAEYERSRPGTSNVTKDRPNLANLQSPPDRDWQGATITEACKVRLVNDIHALATRMRLTSNVFSFISAREAMAMAELGCHHATIPEDIIHQLSLLEISRDPPPGFGHVSYPGTVSQRLAHLSSVDPLLGADPEETMLSTNIDYLANNGEALSKAINEDPVTERGLYEALEAFKANELQSKLAIEEAFRQLDGNDST